MTSQVVGSDYTDGALLPNYVNGRLLVAEDLATSQASLRTRDTRVGETAGAGVVRGLWVTGTNTTITVAPGLAMSGAGEPVVVPRSITLQLTFATAATPASGASFSCCSTDDGSGQGSSLTSGILVLTARPACRLEGSAPMAPSPGSTVSPCCAAQWQVEGVEFRAIALPIGTTVDGITITPGNRRNLVAHWCFGTEQLEQLGVDPFGLNPAYSGFDQLDPADLTPYDVPLAVFRWDGTAVTDLDNWSARRRVTDPDPVPSSWSVTVADRRLADGQARFLQFQDQAEELVSRALARSAAAADFFGLLPPVGFLPVDNAQFRKMAEVNLRAVKVQQANAAEPATEGDTTAGIAAEWAARPYSMSEQYAQMMIQPEVPVMHQMFAAEQPIGVSTQPVDGPPAPAPAPAPAPPSAQKQLKWTELGTFYQNLVDIADASVGYGYDPETFFGRLGRSGGILDWDIAEWALHQSWRADPVSTQQWLIEQLQSELYLRDQASNNSSSSFQAPITYYYVIGNLEAANSATLLRRTSGNLYRGHRQQKQQAGFVRSNLYVVFIVNQRWVTGTTGPFVNYAMRGLLDDS
jgi:hypothetical protein